MYLSTKTVGAAVVAFALATQVAAMPAGRLADDAAAAELVAHLELHNPNDVSKVPKENPEPRRGNGWTPGDKTMKPNRDTAAEPVARQDQRTPNGKHETLK